MGEVVIVVGMIAIGGAVLYSIIQGLRRGPKMPALLLLGCVIIFIGVGVIHDLADIDALRKVMGNAMLVFVPLALGAYAHALHSSSGL